MTVNGAMTAAIQPISKRLEIFEPMMFARRSQVSQRIAAIKFTKSSGIDVPIARMVIPTMSGGIL